MDRRTFIKASLGAMGTVLFCPSLRAELPQSGWITGFKDPQGRYGVAHIKADMTARVLFYTPDRLHGITQHPSRPLVIAPGRRPGPALYVFNLSNQTTQTIDAAPGRHFYGHGLFSEDGNLLFTTENAFDEERGVIGLYDVRDGFKRIGEWDSGGIGPHQMQRFGQKLIVANGGILTHPDTGRAKLNIDSMRPNLSLIDIKSGHMDRQFTLPDDLQQLSIRHIDVDAKGTVFLGLQDQYSNRRDLPLVWKTMDSDLVPLAEPQDGWQIFKGYVGSVCSNGNRLAVSSPHGHCVHVWTETSPETLSLKDVCGLAPFGQGNFLLTSGQGVIRDLTGQTHQQDYRFDNHCTPV